MVSRLTAAVILLLPLTGVQAAPDRTAAERLQQAKTALGGAAELARVRGVTLDVNDRDLLGSLRGNANAARFAESQSRIQLLFPDHFLVATGAAGPVPASRWGFAGKTEIGGGALRWRYRETFGYLALALLLRTDTTFPFTFKGLTKDALHWTDPNGIDVFVDLDSATGLPRAVRYDEIDRATDGSPTGGVHPTRVELADYAPAGALRLPRTLRILRGTTLVQERRVVGIELNPKLQPADFK